MGWIVRLYTGVINDTTITIAAFMDEEDAIDYRDSKLSRYGADNLEIFEKTNE
jgi:hypothetical protein